MKTAVNLVSLSFLVSWTSAVQAVTFPWAIVGNPGNAPDTEVRYNGTTGYGSVDYTYRISKYEVTNGQYTEFLNAVDPLGTNELGLYISQMFWHGGGIEFDGDAANGSKYVTNSGSNQPVVYVSFFDAMRFVNWLENGQGSGSTESGTYTISDGLSETRSASAKFFLPSEDEWYKAAYHKNDGATGNYWDYPTGTDTEPYSDNPASLNTPDDTNVANFKRNDSLENGYDDGFAVTGLTVPWNMSPLTNVGAYSQAASPYGTFDQGGNVLEWNESVINLSVFLHGRGSLGGSWSSVSSDMYSSGMAAWSWGLSTPANEGNLLGFRVASAIVPEPRTVILLSLASVGLSFCRWR